MTEDTPEASGETNIRRLRAAQRFALFQRTSMYLAHGLQPVDLLDLSTTGALVNAAQPPAVGSRVRLTINHKLRLARVVRRDGRQFGVEFAVPLSAEELAQITDQHRRTAAA